MGNQCAEVFEAFRWSGATDATDLPAWFGEAVSAGRARFDTLESGVTILVLDNADGRSHASRGDWIIRDSDGELYRCDAAVLRLDLCGCRKEAAGARSDEAGSSVEELPEGT